MSRKMRREEKNGSLEPIDFDTFQFSDDFWRFSIRRKIYFFDSIFLFHFWFTSWVVCLVMDASDAFLWNQFYKNLKWFCFCDMNIIKSSRPSLVHHKCVNEMWMINEFTYEIWISRAQKSNYSKWRNVKSGESKVNKKQIERKQKTKIDRSDIVWNNFRLCHNHNHQRYRWYRHHNIQRSGTRWERENI